MYCLAYATGHSDGNSPEFARTEAVNPAGRLCAGLWIAEGYDGSGNQSAPINSVQLIQSARIGSNNSAVAELHANGTLYSVARRNNALTSTS